MKINFSKKLVLISGASRGIGRSISKSFASSGAKVCLISRDIKNLKLLSDEIQKEYNITPSIYVGDNSNKSFVTETIKKINDEVGSIDILINNGGGPIPGNYLSFDHLDWQKAYDEILYAPINYITQVSPSMIKNGWGRIINISSIVAVEPSSEMVLSATTRSGLLAFSKAISKEIASSGVTINTVCPSAVLTDRMVDLTNHAAKKQNVSYDSILDSAKKTIPLGRFSTPNEVADLILFLASESASYITGQTILIDGGVSKKI